MQRLVSSAGIGRRARAALVVVLLTGATTTTVVAVEPGEILKDTALEQRARALSTELRCLVCQNQSIDDSDAPLAHDLRVLVREQLTAGKSDRDVLDFIVARYGEFVLLRPRFGMHTLLLWATPLVLLLLGCWLAFAAHRRRTSEAGTAHQAVLSDSERQRLDDLLAADDRRT